MSETLKPCPFCGSSQIMPGSAYRPGQPRRHIVQCGICAASTDSYCDRADALTAWNRRADGWISVAERLPEIGKPMLWLKKGHGLPYEKCEIVSGKLGRTDKDGLVVWQGEDGNFCYLLHRFSDWQPLPAAPSSFNSPSQCPDA